MPRLNLDEGTIFNDAEPVAQEMQVEVPNFAEPGGYPVPDAPQVAQPNRYNGGAAGTTTGRFNSRSRTLREQMSPYDHAQYRERLLDLARKVIVAYPGVNRKDETDVINLAKAFESYVLGER